MCRVFLSDSVSLLFYLSRTVTHLSPRTCAQPLFAFSGAATRPIPRCSAGELSPLVHRPPSSASLCTHPRRRSKAPDPKDKVKEWKKQMRAEERKLDRQITSEGCAPGCHLDGPPPWLTPPPPTPEIKNEETKVKQSVKQAVKRGDTSTAKMLAKEIVRSRKATARLYTSKAQMNSVVMQMQNQMGAPGRRPSAAPRPRHRTCCLTAACHSGLWVCPRSATKGDGAHGEEHGGHGRDEPPRQGRRHQEHDAGDAEGDDEGARDYLPP